MLSNASEMGDNVMKACPRIKWSLIMVMLLCFHNHIDAPTFKDRRIQNSSKQWKYRFALTALRRMYVMVAITATHYSQMQCTAVGNEWGF